MALCSVKTACWRGELIILSIVLFNPAATPSVKIVCLEWIMLIAFNNSTQCNAECNYYTFLHCSD